MIARWSGPAIAVAGAACILSIVVAHPPGDDRVSAWLLWTALSVSQVLPLFGLGVALSVIPAFPAVLGGGAFVAGMFSGFAVNPNVAHWFAGPAGASQHLYLSIPISGLAAGALLIAPNAARRWLAPPFALAIGAMAAITTRLTDPTLHDPAVQRLGLFIGLWIVTAAALGMRAFHRSWFHVPIRILGSWLLASGLLYGGAAIAAKPAAIEIPSPKIQTPADRPPADIDTLFPQFDQPETMRDEERPRP